MRNACLAIALLAAMLPGVASAQLVAYEFVAEVVFVDDPYVIIDGAILEDDVLVGELQYDLSLMDENQDAGVGSYFTFETGDNYLQGDNAASGYFETSEFFGAGIEDNASWGADHLQFYATGDTTPSAITNPQVDYVDLDIELVDYDQTAISSGALPASLDLADFEEAYLLLSGEWFNPEFSGYEFSFIVEAIITSLTPIGSGPAGDFNDDGSVNAADYTVWRDNGLPASDYDDWAANYGATVGGATAAPEPTAVWLLVLCGLAALPRPHSLPKS